MKGQGMDRDSLNVMARFGMIAMSNIINNQELTDSSKVSALKEISEIYDEAMEANKEWEARHGRA